MPRVHRPVTVTMPAHGIVLAESVHAADFRMPVRADPFHKIVYVLSGRVRLLDRHTHHETGATAGTLLAVEAGTAHQFQDDAPATLLLLCIQPRFIASHPDRVELWTCLRAQPSWHVPAGKLPSQHFENLWRRALVEQNAREVGAVIALHALATQILVALARLPRRSPHRDTTKRRIESVAQEIAASFYDDWTLDHAAARAGLSRRRFSELFRAHAGATFLDTLTDHRLQHATKLLRAGEHSVTGVAFSCGYRDLSHFYRLFRQRYGCAPGKFEG